MKCPPVRRRPVLALPLLLAWPAVPAQTPAQSAALLTVSGPRLGLPARQGRFIFDRAALQKMAQRKVVTETPWFKGVSEFEGPLLRDVLAAAGAGSDGGSSLRCTALNDYRVDIPMQDVRELNVVLAHVFNGKPMAVRDKGPLFVIYPFDEQPRLRTTTYYSRCIWQLKAIELT
jgi:hypothetical protein